MDNEATSITVQKEKKNGSPNRSTSKSESINHTNGL